METTPYIMSAFVGIFVYKLFGEHQKIKRVQMLAFDELLGYISKYQMHILWGTRH